MFRLEHRDKYNNLLREGDLVFVEVYEPRLKQNGPTILLAKLLLWIQHIITHPTML